MTEPTENDLPERVENFHKDEPEVWGPAKPKRLLLFGHRFEGNVRRREDRNKSPIGQRIDKFSRRHWRRQMKMRTRRIGRGAVFLTGDLLSNAMPKSFVIPSLGYKTNAIDLELQRERIAQYEVQKLATNSHEARRAIEEDKQCRRDERKKEMQEQWAKRTAAGEVLLPLGVQPSRSERRAEAKLMRKAAKKDLRQQMLAARMLAAIGVPSSPSSPTTTEPSQET